MTTPQIEIQLIAVVASVACALPGVFLVLRRLSMASDAITHSVLLGIVVAFFVVRDLHSPLLIAGAALTGLLTVWLVELLQRTGRVREDAAIGLVFPALFSVGVILVSRYAGDVHLDIDAVLLGEIAFAPFDRFVVAGFDVAPAALVKLTAILLLNVVLIAAFWKELKVATFDPGLAYALGFSPVLLHYGLMGLVSVTAVGAFDAVGSILVVALMVGPPATAFLLTDRLARMLVVSAAVGAIGGVGGYWLAYWLDASIAGAIATTIGLEFTAAFLSAPRRGLVALARRRAAQRVRFAETMLAIHLLNHEGRPEANAESELAHIRETLRWDDAFADRIVRAARRQGLVAHANGTLRLTDRGRTVAAEAIAR